MPLVSLVLRVYAVLLAALGLTGLFAPELAAAEPWAVQALAAALLAFGSSAWLSRDAPLGGIYGRPVVGPQQTFAVIGALVTVRHLGDATPWSLALIGVLGFGAVVWSVLLFRPAWLGAPRTNAGSASDVGSPPPGA